jgi:hypothetical protein
VTDSLLTQAGEVDPGRKEPIGLKAGKGLNLPTNVFAPDDLVSVFKFINIGKSSWEYLNAGSWPDSLDRARILWSHKVQTLVPHEVPISSRTIGARQGGSVFASNLGPGEVAGSSGAGPCVILVIKGPGSGFVRAWHFEATDSVTATLARDLAGSSGGRAGIAGDLEDDKTGNALLATVLAVLKNRNIAIDGYHKSDELWVDSNGHWVKRR